MLAFVIAAFAGGGAPALAAAPSAPPNASLGSPQCRPGFTSLDRIIGVTATMRPLAGADQMEMRFQLLARLPGERFHLVHGGDLGRWLQEPPASGGAPVTAWVVKKQVLNLYAPAAYRLRVTFRWLSQSLVSASATRFSPVCLQS